MRCFRWISRSSCGQRAMEMNVFHSLFLDYNILGGMPAVVAEYIERNTFEGSQEDLRANKNPGVYKGGLYENMVGEALIKQGYKLFYYKKENSTLEADFFIRSTASLIPVEVKAKSALR